jgi:hypothetical protein
MPAISHGQRSAATPAFESKLAELRSIATGSQLECKVQNTPKEFLPQHCTFVKALDSSLRGKLIACGADILVRIVAGKNARDTQKTMKEAR